MPPVKLLRKKSFDRTVTKKCPKCEDKVPVACRYCPCGHQFSSKKLNPSPPADHSLGTRRTKRTSRERPDYFNSLVLDNQSKQARRKREQSQSSVTSEPPVSPKKRRGRPKGTPNKEKEGKIKPAKTPNKTPSKEEEEPEKEPPVQEEDLYSNLSTQKTWQLSMILADINRKFNSQTFNPS